MKFWYAVCVVSTEPQRYTEMCTFQERLELVELAGVIKLPEVFRLLREVFPLRKSVSLVCDNV